MAATVQELQAEKANPVNPIPSSQPLSVPTHKVLPNDNKSETTKTFQTYRAQLMLGHKKEVQVNVAAILPLDLHPTFSIPHFSALPCYGEKKVS